MSLCPVAQFIQFMFKLTGPGVKWTLCDLNDHIPMLSNAKAKYEVEHCD